VNIFQEEVCKIIHFTLGSRIFYDKILTSGYKEIFVQFLRQFSGISSTGKNTWKKIDLYKKHHRISDRAAKIIDGYGGDINELWKELHYEHIIPNSVLMRKLINLGFAPDIEMVKNVMSQSEVVILSREEAKLLDGSETKEYPLEGKLVFGKGMKSKGEPKERLKIICATFDKRYSSNKL